jgi:Tfp pilus assembly protein PilN
MSLMDLNLLPSSAKFQASKVKLQKSVRKIAIWIIAGWVAVALIIFALTLVVKIRTVVAESQLKKAKDAYLAMSDNIITSQILKYRAKTVGQVLDSRFEYGKAFEEMNGLFPPGVTLTEFKLINIGKLQLSAATDGGVNMDKVEAVVAGVNKGQNPEFKNAKITSLSFKDNSWTFALEVNLK